MTEYNGWTPKERSEGELRINRSIAKGDIKLSKRCEICSQTEGLIMNHLEDYNSDDVHELCVECHMKLHSRFKLPNKWLNHIENVKCGKISKVYYTVYAYIQSEPFEDEQPIKRTELGSNWWEQLSMKPVDLKKELYG